jgi:hypothetical protein
MEQPNSISERQAAFDNISDEDLAKIQKVTGSGDSVKVDEEWLILAEFAKHFGWEAYKDVRKDFVEVDVISSGEMMTLIAAARKLDHLALYNQARAAFIGTGAAQSKKPSETFKRVTDGIIKHTKADE